MQLLTNYYLYSCYIQYFSLITVKIKYKITPMSIKKNNFKFILMFFEHKPTTKKSRSNMT